MIIRETMEAYLARPAVSSSMVWDIINDCPRYAFLRSPFCPNPVPRASTDRMDFGTVAHLAVLEPETLEARVDAVSANDWRTKGAKELRAEIEASGKLALLAKDMDRVFDLREELKASEAAPYLFGDGENEVTFIWDHKDPFSPSANIPCKARIDRLAKIGGHNTLVHLKTSQSANPLAFAQIAARLGYDLTAAWYRDGWREQEESSVADDDVFVVVSAEAPHMVTLIDFDSADITGGRTFCHRALAEFSSARETGVWRGYGRKPGRQTVRMPAWYRRNMFEMEGVGHG